MVLIKIEYEMDYLSYKIYYLTEKEVKQFHMGDDIFYPVQIKVNNSIGYYLTWQTHLKI